jgi:ligand-binding sensor domain-containing protein
MTESLKNTDMVYALAQKGKVLYAAKASRLRHSNDGGESGHDALTSLGLTGLAITDILCLESQLLTTTTGGVLSSVDGKHRQAIPFRKPFPTLSAIAASPNFAHNQTLFTASLQDGLFRSEDAGKTWTAWNIGLLDLRVLSLCVTQADEVYASTETGLYLSKTSGRSWKALALPFAHDAILSLLRVNEGLFVGTEHQGLYLYKDGLWEKLEPPKGAINKLLALANHELIVLIKDEVYLLIDRVFEPWKDVSGVSSIALLNDSEVLVGFNNGDIQREKL